MFDFNEGEFFVCILSFFFVVVEMIVCVEFVEIVLGNCVICVFIGCGYYGMFILLVICCNILENFFWYIVYILY